MDCLHCCTTLIPANRKGLEFNYCPSCFGAWLDSRDLDRFISTEQHQPLHVHVPSVNRQPQAGKRSGAAKPSADTEEQTGHQLHPPEPVQQVAIEAAS
ncbi:MAG: zf-TFIIB domain-containing protein [Pseudomonadota bacterium]